MVPKVFSIRRGIASMDDPLLNRVVTSNPPPPAPSATPANLAKSDNDYVLTFVAASNSAALPAAAASLNPMSAVGAAAGGGAVATNPHIPSALANSTAASASLPPAAAAAQSSPPSAVAANYLHLANAFESHSNSLVNQFFRQRERRKKERHISSLASALTSHSSYKNSSRLLKPPIPDDLHTAVSDSYLSLANTQGLPVANSISLEIGLNESTAVNDESDSDAPTATGLLWSSDAARISEARLSWTVPLSHDSVAALPHRSGFLERNGLSEWQALQQRNAYARFSVIRKGNVSEKPSVTDLQELSRPRAEAPLKVIPPSTSPANTNTDEITAVAPTSNTHHQPANGASAPIRAATPSACLSETTKDLFAKKTVVGTVTIKNNTGKKSTLALLLNDQGATENPFADNFGFLSGKGEAYPIRIKIFIPTSPTPSEPLLIILKRDATVEELIGYTLYEYFNKLSTTSSTTPDGQSAEDTYLPEDKRDVCCWNLRLVEDDGTIDEDFPALDRTSKMQRSNFDALALCLCTPAQVATNQASRKLRTVPSNAANSAIGATGMARSARQPMPGSASSINASGTLRTGTISGGMPTMASAGTGTKPAHVPLPPLPPVPHGADGLQPFRGNITTSGSGAQGASGNSAGRSIAQPATANNSSDNAGAGRYENVNAVNVGPASVAALSPQSGVDRVVTNNNGSNNDTFAEASPAPSKQQLFVKIHLYSTLEVKHTATLAFNAGTSMAEVFETVCLRRKYDKESYVLKMADTRTDVALDMLLEDMPALEFSGDIFFRPSHELKNTAERDHLDLSAEEISSMYRQYNVTQKQMIGRNDRTITLDGEFVHIMSSGDGKTLVDTGKTITYHISGIVSCTVVRGRTVRLIVSKSGSPAGNVPSVSGVALVTTGVSGGSAATPNGIALEFDLASEKLAGDLCARVGLMAQASS
ncbi:hypothetical protein HDU82_004664 [Entophlyctis luteolus]|nr:hypothetical protein HDU82_004664 [Entophlyctis luteolus]